MNWPNFKIEILVFALGFFLGIGFGEHLFRDKKTNTAPTLRELELTNLYQMPLGTPSRLTYYPIIIEGLPVWDCDGWRMSVGFEIGFTVATTHYK